jgi:homospermidine synthase
VGTTKYMMDDIIQQDSYPKYGKIAGKVLIIGFGSIGQGMLPLILRHFYVDPAKITVLELGEHEELFKQRYPDIAFVSCRIKKDNLDSELSKYVDKGGLIIDCSLNIDGITIVKWALDHDVMYINTSIERWEDEPDETLPDMASRTLYHTHQQIRKEVGDTKGKSTCVVTHGANPGLVTHFVKRALLDIAKAMDLKVKVPQTRQGWAKLLQLTGTKVIQIAERDTQVIDKPKVKGEFVNTWSCEGFWAEGRAPAEMGWGSHEDPKGPDGGALHSEGPCNAAYLKQPGVATLVKSCVPTNGPYNGFLIQHSEAITISEWFSVMEGDKCVWRPTVYYAYCPFDGALASAHEFRGQELEIQTVKRIVKDEIVSGMDELGVLLLGHGKGAWWYGSQLTIDEARKLLPHESATSVQVESSMLGALVWMLNNPTEGYTEPEAIPFQEVLAVAGPYLGPIASTALDWTPTEDRNVLFKRALDKDNPWRFENFRVWS